MKLEDTKQQLLSIMKVMMRFKDASVSELVKETGYSNTTIRCHIDWLKQQQLITSRTLDLSVNGRNPSYYHLQAQRFVTLGLFLEDETVDISIRDILGKVFYENHIYIKETKELEDFVVELAKRFQVTCICVGGAGVVDGDYFYRDRCEVLMPYGITANLKQRLTIPVLIENDVRCMLMGYQCKQPQKSLAYLYIANNGVGSSYDINGHIWKGANQFSGELGFVPFHGRRINDVMKEHPDEKTVCEMLIQMIVMVCTLIDPHKIVITGKQVPWQKGDQIQEECERLLCEKYPLSLDFRNFPLIDAMDGLHYIAVLHLFEEYTK